MAFKTILVPIEQHDLMNSTLQTALLLARKFDSYIEGFALRVEFPAVFAVGDVGAVPIPALEQDIADNGQRSRGLFENFMHEHGVPRAGDTKALSSGWLEMTGEAVLARAKALGCDLLIKGAYTQSRLRQMIFGGTTRYILSNAELPVLMAH
jgi:nucleotide-binding universal stress UspA family protein